MTFNDPVVGGQTLIRPAIQSPNYSPGSSGSGTGWAVKEDGSAEFNDLTTNGIAQGGSATYDNITANQSFIYQGTELSQLLTPASQGTVAYGSFTAPTGSTTTTEVQLGTFNIVVDSARAYCLQITNLQFFCSTRAIGNGALYRIRDASNGNAQLAELAIFDGGVSTNPGAIFLVELIGLSSGTHTLSITVQSNNSTQLNIVASTVVCILRDDGILPANTAAAATTPPAASHSFTMNATHTASYTGSGAQSNGSGADVGDRMYFGQDPGYAPNGNWRSYAWFNGGTNLSDMAGYVSCSKFDLTVNVPWWYKIAGGTLLIGFTFDTSGSPPGTEPASHSYQVGSANFTARGQTITIPLLGVSSIMNAVKSGQLTGFILGPGPAGDYDYYGYAEGADHGMPQLSAAYTK